MTNNQELQEIECRGVAKIKESMTTKGSETMKFENCKKVIYIQLSTKVFLSVNAISRGEVLLTRKEVTISKDQTVLKYK